MSMVKTASDSDWVFKVDCSYRTDDLSDIPVHVREYVEEKQRLCCPANIHVCDGSQAEYDALIDHMIKLGMLVKLAKHPGCYLARTDPADVARVESHTFISTPKEEETVPKHRSGVHGKLGNWMSPADLEKELGERLPGCMKGRTMYVVPFSMGPVGSPMSKIGIQLTDSPYVAASMRIMTRMGRNVLVYLGENDFVKCLHSVGQPLPMKTPLVNNWPCNPEKSIISHKPYNNEIISWGSGYGGNSLLGKKCLALRLGSVMGYREGWLAEHMLILGITNPAGVKKYIVAAFPSACGKTNLAMITPTLPGWKAECVGDDIAWMRFDENGVLRAINPENGFFGVAPGTSMKTNPNGMLTIQENTIFTNVAETSDGGFWWEGLPPPPEGVTIKSWLGEPWTPGCGKPAAHPNSRFCTPARQCPIIDPAWEDPKGVPVSAIIFGGRRPEGKAVMHDPFAMRPFFGYNFCNYMRHWLNFGKKEGLKLPRIYHVNWFRKGPNGFLWPGFGENCRIIDWILRRVDGDENIATRSAVGYFPRIDSINLKGLKDPVDMEELFALPKDFWFEEVAEIRDYFDTQLGDDVPEEIVEEMNKLEKRIKTELK